MKICLTYARMNHDIKIICFSLNNTITIFKTPETEPELRQGSYTVN